MTASFAWSCGREGRPGSAGDVSGSCRTSCEANDWPNIIVGIVGDAGGLACKMVRGGQTFSSSGGCPSEFDTTRYLCTCTFDTTPDDATAELLMVDSTGATVSEITIELSDWNKCGRDIAYTEYTPDDDAWSQTRYLNPCGSP